MSNDPLADKELNISRKSSTQKRLKGLKDFIKRLSSKVGSADDVRISSEQLEVPKISTGSILLDKAIGGGIPRGKITEIYGKEGSGKTTLALSVAREALNENKNNIIIYIDVECAITDSLLMMNGVDRSRLIVVSPTSAEDVFEYIHAVLQDQSQLSKDEVLIPLIVVDSVAAMVPMEEKQGGMRKVQMGLQARIMSKGVKGLVYPLVQTLLKIKLFDGTALIFINQVRINIKVMFGNPETTTGGRALGFYSSMRLEIREVSIKNLDLHKDVKHAMKVGVVKNKLMSKQDPVVINVIDGIGFDKLSEMIDIAIEKRVLTLRGSWILYETQNLGQGRKKSKEFLLQNPEILKQIAENAMGKDFSLDFL